MTKDYILDNAHVAGALYFLEAGHYLLRAKQPGGVVTEKTITAPDVAAAFMGQDFDSGFLPAGILRMGTCPAGMWSAMALPAAKVAISLVGMPDGERVIEVKLPAMLLMGMGNKYLVYALSGDGNRKSAVYSAPLPNVYRSGEVCFGGNVVPKARPENLPDVWKLFITSPFNEHLSDKKSRKHPGDVRKMLIEVAERGKVYPLNDLNLEFRNMEEMFERKLREAQYAY